MSDLRTPLLTVRGMKTYFPTFQGLVKAVDGVDFDLYPGEVLALVGESGSGKSVSAQTVMGLHSPKHSRIEGSIQFEGTELIGAPMKTMLDLRGAGIGMIFQEPMSAFDPLYTVGAQMVEAHRLHFPGVSVQEARQRAIEALQSVGIPDSKRRFGEYAHQMSGGMLQRMLIALVIMNKPRMLIADEPTTALDVTIQAQVLRLMKKLQQDTGMAILFITHDLGVVAEMADRVHVMYAGRIVERGTAREVFGSPQHPYTQGLLASKVRPEYKKGALPYIQGVVPRAFEFPEGCRFHPRCSFATDRCRSELPTDSFPLVQQPLHGVACHLYNPAPQETV